MTSAGEEEEEGEALKEMWKGEHLEAGQATGGSQAGQHPCSPQPPAPSETRLDAQKGT